MYYGNRYGGYSYKPAPTIHTSLNKYKIGEEVEFNIICQSAVVEFEDTGFGVYTVEMANDDKAIFKAQGTFIGGLVNGQTYNVKGKIVEYKGEIQLRIKEYMAIKPVSKKGIIAYLKTLYGLKSKAELIYSEFGDKSIDVLIKDPLQVAEKIRGIGKKSVVKWQEQLKELDEDRHIFVKLLGYGISNKNANSLLAKFGVDIINIIEENPYLLMNEIKGYGFLKCDKIYLETGKSITNEHRIRAGILHVLNTAQLEGHCYIPLEEMMIRVDKLLSLRLPINEMKSLYSANSHLKECNVTKYDRTYTVDVIKLNECIELYNKLSLKDRENARYVLEEVNIAEIGNQINYLISDRQLVFEENKLYLRKLYFAERSLSRKIKQLAVYKPVYKAAEVEKVLNQVCKEKGYTLEAKQREACITINMYDEGIFLLIGSAGTGKTFVLNLVLEVSKRLKAKYKKKSKATDILAVAPTGRASKVATKSIGFECKTVHRALGYSQGAFEMNETNPFTNDIFVCDESSMLDVELADNFFKAIVGGKTILMGDIKQLPSVGAGNVLKDLIDSGIVKTIMLDVIKRQEEGSNIIDIANDIIEKRPIRTPEGSKNAFVIPREGVTSVRNGVLSAIKRMLTFPEFTLEEVQVLLPQRTGDLGVNFFNLLIQEKYNPIKEHDIKILKTKFQARLVEDGPITEHSLYIHKGDKVMHIKNNYTMKLYSKNMLGDYKAVKEGITNGEMGIVHDIVKTKDGLNVIVKYEDLYAIYDDGIEELELAFATTIHKSQGSAWKGVILPIVPQHTNMLSNNIFYTGVTRARDFLAVIGSLKSMNIAVNNTEVAERYTNLNNKILAA